MKKEENLEENIKENIEEKVEGIDYIVCQVCKEKVGRVYGAHLKKHGMSSKDYKEKFPDAPLMTHKDKKNTSKNSGKHMKQEKYRKMFSEKMIGEKNPNHKSKTTEEERQQRSPFSKKFIKYKNDEERMAFIKEATKDIISTTKIEYYLNKGYSQEESEKLLKERQTTFSLEICINKYGEEEGKRIYKDRQAKWQKSLVDNGNLKCGYSKVSQDLFWELLDSYNVDDRKEIYFATKNQEYFISKKGTDKDPRIFLQYDFCDRINKKIIEYNGDEYHGNPSKYKSTDTPHPFRKQITAQEIWDKDAEKIRIANEEGFEVLTIWDTEYKKKRKDIIKRCLDFLDK